MGLAHSHLATHRNRHTRRNLLTTVVFFAVNGRRLLQGQARRYAENTSDCFGSCELPRLQFGIRSR